MDQSYRLPENYLSSHTSPSPITRFIRTTLERGAIYDVADMQPAGLQLVCKLLIVHVSHLSEEGVVQLHFRVTVDFFRDRFLGFIIV